MKEKSDDLSVFDFGEDDVASDGPRPQLMRKIRESFMAGDRKKKKNWKADDDWKPPSSIQKSRSSNGSIGFRTRGKKGVLPVIVLDENRHEAEALERKQKEKELELKRLQEENEAKEYRALLREIMNMSRSSPLEFPQDDPDRVTITADDIDVLRPLAFLNDTIIDFYIKHLQTTLSEREKKMSYFFNSFFFPKLVELSSLTGEEAKTAFSRLEKWTKNEDMFAKDFIFIPVNRSSHWSLIIICFLSDVVFEEIDPDVRSNSTFILHFDSFDGFHSDIEPVIRNYLSQEWSKRKSNDQLQRQFDRIKFVRAKVPQQDNLHDCGLFLLHYVELFLERGFDCPRGQLSFITEDWFDPASASAKRISLVRLIHDKYVEKLDSQGECSRGFSRSSRRSSSGFIDDDEDLVMLHGSSP